MPAPTPKRGAAAPRPKSTAGQRQRSAAQPAAPCQRRADDLAQVLYDQALLAEGGKLEDPAAFVKRINKLMLELSA